MPEQIQGYYSLIQYCPCPARDERMNIGIALLVESRRFIQTAFLAGAQYRDIADQFPRDKTPWEVIEESANVMALRMTRIKVLPYAMPPEEHSLFSFAQQNTSGAIRVTTPRSLIVEGEPADALARLFCELVEITP